MIILLPWKETKRKAICRMDHMYAADDIAHRALSKLCTMIYPQLAP